MPPAGKSRVRFVSVWVFWGSVYLAEAHNYPAMAIIVRWGPPEAHNWPRPGTEANYAAEGGPQWTIIAIKRIIMRPRTIFQTPLILNTL